MLSVLFTALFPNTCNTSWHILNAHYVFVDLLTILLTRSIQERQFIEDIWSGNVGEKNHGALHPEDITLAFSCGTETGKTLWGDLMEFTVFTDSGCLEYQNHNQI